MADMINLSSWRRAPAAIAASCLAITLTSCAVEGEDVQDNITEITSPAELVGRWTTGCYNAADDAPNADMPYALNIYEFNLTEFGAAFAEFSSSTCSTEEGTSLVGGGSGTYTLGSMATLTDGSAAIEINLTYTDGNNNSATDFELVSRDGNRLFFGLELPDPAQRPNTVDKNLPYNSQ